MHVLVYGITPSEHDAAPAAGARTSTTSRSTSSATASPTRSPTRSTARTTSSSAGTSSGCCCCSRGSSASTAPTAPLHREAFEPVLDRLTRAGDREARRDARPAPRWPEPWVKARTGGSDDHGLLNIGRTWTEFPPETQRRSTTCSTACAKAVPARRRGGVEREAGAHVLQRRGPLLHAAHHVAGREAEPRDDAPADDRRRAAGAVEDADAPSSRSKRKLQEARRRSRARRSRRRQPKPAARHRHAEAPVPRRPRCKRLGEHPALRSALDAGLPPLGEHDGDVPASSRGSTATCREGLAAAITESIDDASFTGLFDSIAAILGQQFVLLAVLLRGVPPEQGAAPAREITGSTRRKTRGDAAASGCSPTRSTRSTASRRFLRDMGEQAERARPAPRRSTRAAPTPRIRPARPQELRPAAVARRCRTTRSCS